MKAPRPSQQTIAEACGVSRMTVSLALRGNASIPAATQARIRSAAERLRYRPDPMVSALMAQVRAGRKTHYRATLAVIHRVGEADWRTIFPAAYGLAEGLETRAAELGFRLETFWLRDPRWAGGRLARSLRSRGVVGVVVAPMPGGMERIDFDFAGFAASALGLSLREPALHCATSNYVQIVQLAHRQLRESGCRRIGLVLEGALDGRTRHQWLGGYLAEQEEIGVPEIRPLLGRFGRAEFLAWCTRHRLDAVISAEPENHLKWLRSGGAELAGVSYACLTLSPNRPNIAGVLSNPIGVGAAAIDLVVAQINRNERGLPAEPRIVQLPALWVPGPTVVNRGGGAGCAVQLPQA